MEDKERMRYIFLVLMMINLFTLGCAKKDRPKPKETLNAEKSSENPNAANVQQKVLAFNLEGMSEKGQKKWEVNGESAEAISQDEIKLNNIVAKTYGDEAEATITADKGIYDKAKNNVKLEENVRAIIENTEAFAAEHIDLPGQVAGQSGAKGMSDKSRAKTKTVITCAEEAVFDYEKGMAYFNKNVRVRGDDGNIDADRLTVNLDKESKKIETIIAEGNVKIQRGENVTYSEKAIYKEAAKKVTLTGNPKVVISQEGDFGEKFLK